MGCKRAVAKTIDLDTGGSKRLYDAASEFEVTIGTLERVSRTRGKDYEYGLAVRLAYGA